jgi:tetratricopeptide (TPR) repeat protein
MIIQLQESAIALWRNRPGSRVQRARELDATGRTDEAVEAYQDALGAASGQPAWHHELGEVLFRNGRYEEAERAFAAAVALSPKRAKWQHQLARARRRVGDFDGAVAAYRAALQLQPEHPRWHYELGMVLERTAGADAARASYAAGLALDRSADDRHAELLAHDYWRFPPRRRLLDFVGNHLDEIRDRAQPSPQPLTDPKIYVYWAQGMSGAPAVVQRCQEALHRLHPGGEVAVLDESVWASLDVPARTREVIRHRLTHGSDVLRLELLARYGGIWLDATCLVRRPLVPEPAAELTASGFFAFERGTYRPSSWLLMSAPGDYIVTTLRAALHVYWENFDNLVDYYLIHHLFEMLCQLDPPFRERWEASPRLSYKPARDFKAQMFEPYDEAQYLKLLNASFISKLSYKKQHLMTPDSMLAWFLEHGPPT